MRGLKAQLYVCAEVGQDRFLLAETAGSNAPHTSTRVADSHSSLPCAEFRKSKEGAQARLPMPPRQLRVCGKKWLWYAPFDSAAPALAVNRSLGGFTISTERAQARLPMPRFICVGGGRLTMAIVLVWKPILPSQDFWRCSRGFVRIRSHHDTSGRRIPAARMVAWCAEGFDCKGGR